MKSNFVYVLTRDDTLELPLIVEDTLEEISKKFNISFWILFRHCADNSVIKGGYRIRKVDIRDPLEKFTFDDYDRFCIENLLKKTDFKSLQRFRQTCFGV